MRIVESEIFLADGIVASIWMIVNLLLFGAVWRTAERFFAKDDLPTRLLHSFILFWASIVGAAFILNAVGVLTGFAMLAACGLVTLIMLVIRPRQSDSREHSENRSFSVWGVVWAAAFSLAVGHVIANGLLQFPSDWDSLNYHIPMITQWLHAGSLYAPDCFHWSNPGNNELIGLWLVAPFSGDFLIAFNNLPAVVILACATFQLSRLVGLGRNFAHLCALAVVCHFVVVKQLVDSENDIAVAALFVACVVYAIRWNENQDRAELMLGAISLGLLAGVKFYALGYTSLAFVTWISVLLRNVGWRRTLGPTFILVAGGLAFGGYWYLRNFWISGSPLYPRDFFVNPDILHRIYPCLAQTSFVGNGSPELLRLYLQSVWKMTGPCQFCAVVATPFSIVWLICSFWQRRTNSQAVARLVIASLVMITVAVLAITPFAVEDEPQTLNQMHWHYCPVRYGMCYLTMATIALVVVLEDVVAWLRAKMNSFSEKITSIAGVGICCLAIGSQLVFDHRFFPIDRVGTLVAAGNCALLYIAVVLIVANWPRFRIQLMMALCMSAVVGFPFAVEFLQERWHDGFARHYNKTVAPEVFTWLNKHGDAGAKIAVLEMRSYPFFGSRRQFRVCQPIWLPSSDALLDYLKCNEVQIVAAQRKRKIRGFQIYRWFDKCLKRHGKYFKLIDTRWHGRFPQLFRFATDHRVR